MAEEMRPPCPNRIIDDTGGAFVMGAVGGGVWHWAKGYRNSPRPGKWKGAVSNMRLRAPTLGGNFAVWGLLFSACDCSLAHMRQKDDSLNAVASGAITGGVLAARAGWKAIGRNAMVGGVLLAAIEGLTVAVQRMFAQPDPLGQPPIPTPKTSQTKRGSALALTRGVGGLQEEPDYAFDDDSEFHRTEVFA